jgi:hypothetical protein
MFEFFFGNFQSLDAFLDRPYLDGLSCMPIMICQERFFFRTYLIMTWGRRRFFINCTFLTLSNLETCIYYLLIRIGIFFQDQIKKTHMDAYQSTCFYTSTWHTLYRFYGTWVTNMTSGSLVWCGDLLCLLLLLSFACSFFSFFFLDCFFFSLSIFISKLKGWINVSREKLHIS